MTGYARHAPPNSLVLISDKTGGDVPNFRDDAVVFASSSAVIVGCRSSADGETGFVLGAGDEVDPSTIPAFDGTIKTPNLAVKVTTVDGRTLLEEAVRSMKTRVRVWINHPREPDQVIVGLD